MQAFLSNGGLSKMLYIILTFLLGVAAIVLLFIEVFYNQPINPFVQGIVAGILGHAFTVGGHMLSSKPVVAGAAESPPGIAKAA